VAVYVESVDVLEAWWIGEGGHVARTGVHVETLAILRRDCVRSPFGNLFTSKPNES
jgi:hypothetical protein